MRQYSTCHIVLALFFYLSNFPSRSEISKGITVTKHKFVCVRQNKLEHQSLEQRNIHYRATQGEWVACLKKQELLGTFCFSKALLRAK